MPHSTLVQVCVEIILEWHKRFGPESFRSRFGEGEAHYAGVLEKLSGLDLSEPRAQTAVAHAQRAGPLEWAYTTRIPEDLWSRLGDCPRSDELPRSLGQLAGWVLEHIERVGEPELRRLVAGGLERVRRAADEFYSPILGPASEGLGGAGALLGCSLERTPIDRDEGVRLLHPEVLGLEIVRPGQREDDLIDAIRQGVVEVVEAVGEPGSDYPSASR
jgi:hypothetical protein